MLQIKALFIQELFQNKHFFLETVTVAKQNIPSKFAMIEPDLPDHDDATNEPRREKTNVLQMRKQRRRSASR